MFFNVHLAYVEKPWHGMALTVIICTVTEQRPSKQWVTFSTKGSNVKRLIEYLDLSKHWHTNVRNIDLS